MPAHKIAVVGIGKISLDQHLPVIAKNPAFELVGLVSQRGVEVGDVPSFRSQSDLFNAIPEVTAIANCVPPAPRHNLVREALDAGKHVLIEKPPAATMAEFNDMVRHADKTGRVLFATWHSQFNAAVDKARDIIAEEGLRRLRIDWRENVRKWHPGQDWVWEPGGFGVCDPGINALSILTKIVPEPLFVEKARLDVPQNRQTPVSAEIRFRTVAENGPDISAGFDWLEESGEVWTIAIETGRGRQLKLEAGGSKLLDGNVEIIAEPMAEYEGIYDRFDQLLRSGKSDIHCEPLQLMCDIFFIAERNTVAPFAW